MFPCIFRIPYILCLFNQKSNVCSDCFYPFNKKTAESPPAPDGLKSLISPKNISRIHLIHHIIQTRIIPVRNNRLRQHPFPSNRHNLIRICTDNDASLIYYHTELLILTKVPRLCSFNQITNFLFPIIIMNYSHILQISL